MDILPGFRYAASGLKFYDSNSNIMSKLKIIVLSLFVSMLLICMFAIGAWLLKLVVVHTNNVLFLTTEMVQVEANVVGISIEKSNTNRRGFDFYPHEIYFKLEYQLNGEKRFYRGPGKVGFTVGYASRQHAEEFLTKRIKDSRIVGYVHPSNPDEFYVIKPQLGFGYFFMLFISLFTTVGSIYAFVRWQTVVASIVRK